MNSSTPCSMSLLIARSIRVYRPTDKSGLGVSLVNGRRRLPKPAAKIIAFIKTPISYEALVPPCPEERQPMVFDSMLRIR